MGYRRCAIPNCASVASGPTTKTFHKVLVKNSSRDLEKWGRACGVQTFSNDSFVCSDHFRDEDFNNPSCKSQGLRPTAVPSSVPALAPAEMMTSYVCDQYQDENCSLPNCANQGLRPTAVVSSVPAFSGQISLEEKPISMDEEAPISEWGAGDGASFIQDEPMDEDAQVSKWDGAATEVSWMQDDSMDEYNLAQDVSIVGEVVIDGSSETPPHIPLTSHKNQPASSVFDHVDHDYCFNANRYVLMADRLVELEEENLKLKQELRKNKQSVCKKAATIRKLRLELKNVKQNLKAVPTNPLHDPILCELQKNKNRKCRGARYSDADILCIPCALKITEKYLNMLICCKLSTMNDKFKSTADQKKKNRRSDKAKKLNISRLSELMVDTPSVESEPKKKYYKKKKNN